ncbi:MAG: phosphate signaling complex protein PhoU [Candidatus Ratteibacteria bacterium]|jgi:phosphate transport system protein
MERHFDLELEELKRTILTMSGMVEEAINKAVTSLEKLSPEIANEVIQADNRIDRLENEIDEKTIAFIVRNQPVAGDLRLIVMATKIGTDLERMADLAVDIAERTLELVGQPLIKPLIDIPKLARLAQKMTHESIESFITLDGELARDVRTQDDEADYLRNLVTRELTEIISRDCSVAARTVPLILVARHLERICDHATNIAESVVYVAEAKLIKHGEEE